MSTGISLVRENAASLQPPRTLWVSFPLGRPLGVPNDGAFQHRVIEAALALLDRDNGPILEDFPEDAPAVGLDDAPACPVSFKSLDESWRGRLTSELQSLAPWYEIGLRRRGGRTLVGICDSNEREIVERMAEDLDNARLPTDLKWFKAAVEDIKAYYVEALTAQPGQYESKAIYDVLWHQTTLGAGLRVLYDAFLADPKRSAFARILLPRDATAQEKPS